MQAILFPYRNIRRSVRNLRENHHHSTVVKSNMFQCYSWVEPDPFLPFRYPARRNIGPLTIPVFVEWCELCYKWKNKLKQLVIRGLLKSSVCLHTRARQSFLICWQCSHLLTKCHTAIYKRQSHQTLLSPNVHRFAYQYSDYFVGHALLECHESFAAQGQRSSWHDVDSVLELRSLKVSIWFKIQWDQMYFSIKMICFYNIYVIIEYKPHNNSNRPRILCAKHCTPANRSLIAIVNSIEWQNAWNNNGQTQ